MDVWQNTHSKDSSNLGLFCHLLFWEEKRNPKCHPAVCRHLIGGKNMLGYSSLRCVLEASRPKRPVQVAVALPPNFCCCLLGIFRQTSALKVCPALLVEPGLCEGICFRKRDRQIALAFEKRASLQVPLPVACSKRPSLCGFAER